MKKETLAELGWQDGDGMDGMEAWQGRNPRKDKGDESC